MPEHHNYHVSEDAAEVYERNAVPSVFAQWAPQVATAAQVAPGDRILDVGCGTGVLARTVADLVADERQVTGLDLNEGMLAVARRLRPSIDWQQGDAVQLPFGDDTYDVVVSQFVLMHVPDPIAAVKEMVRVLRPGGRLAHTVFGPFERATGIVILTEIAERRCGPAAVDALTAAFSLGDEDKLRDLFRAAGINDVVVELRPGTMVQPSIETFITTRVKTSPLGAALDEEGFQGLLAEAKDVLQPFCTPDGKLVMPNDAYIVTGEKPHP